MKLLFSLLLTIDVALVLAAIVAWTAHGLNAAKQPNEPQPGLRLIVIACLGSFASLSLPQEPSTLTPSSATITNQKICQEGGVGVFFQGRALIGDLRTSNFAERIDDLRREYLGDFLGLDESGYDM